MVKIKNNTKQYLKSKGVVVFCILVCIFIFMIVRLTYIMLKDSNKYSKIALAQRTTDIEISATRGNIYDRNEGLLVTSVNDFRVDVDMNTLTDSLKRKNISTDKLITKLSSILKISSNKITNILYPERLDGSRIKFATLARQIDKSQSDQIKALKLDGFIISSDTKREYENNNFLSTVLGCTNLNGSGVTGVERSYNKELSGIPGRKKVETDKNKNELPYKEALNVEPIAGKNVVLTIDENIQSYAEEIAEEALSNNKAKSVTITVMNPNNGEILAMVSKPDYNPNNLGSQIISNSAVQDNFEPGSIFKVITAYAGLATGIVKDANSYDFDCDGSISVNEKPINCWQQSGHGKENFIDIIKNSCNVGFVELGRKIGKSDLYKYEKLFGFGQKTGIDLPGEAAGVVKPLDKINDFELSENSFGQGVAVTAVQYMAAFNAVANGGTWIRPHIMKEINHIDNGKKVVDKNYDDFGKKKILDSKLTSQLKTYLEKVVSDVHGVGHNAFVEKYHIAGKTGTAQIADKKIGGYNHSTYMSSFAGMAPVNNPKITILISVNQPSGSDYFASSVAAPYAKELYTKIFNYIDINK